MNPSSTKNTFARGLMEARPLADMLFVSQNDQLCLPIRLGEWLLIVRLEKFISAKSGEQMRQGLLNKLFEAWLKKQINE